MAMGAQLAKWLSGLIGKNGEALRLRHIYQW
ncbi:hypothetical protein ACVWXO_006316 [Bradyrhizobium sp. LM2.7]